MGWLFLCCDDTRRRNEIAGRSDVNGIEFLEVLDTPEQSDDERQRTLFVHFINDPSGLAIAPANVTISGGERIRDMRVVGAQVTVDSRSGSTSPVLVVDVDAPGDFSTYTLQLGPTDANPLPGLDAILRSVDFSFKVNCETEFDPLRTKRCAVEPHEEPALDYLARDFPSLREFILDRLAVQLPEWQERNEADFGIALVELMAFLGDQLSYRQDAVATEAYLGTCRLRTSARRHARLVDYLMHDGCNARAWVQVRLEDGTPAFELDDATFYTTVPGLLPRILPGSHEDDRARSSGAAAFQVLRGALLAPEHNVIRFYTWGARECCLPKGATKATLRGELPNLKPDMILVFKEARSPATGDPDDADRAHRHAVRLESVTHTVDPVGGRFDLPPTGDAVAVTEITWSTEDALPFPLCISAETSEELGAAFVDEVSVALGNIVLADHGADVEEMLGVAPEDTLEQVLVAMPDDGTDSERCPQDRTVMANARFRPFLGYGPLTQAAPDDTGASATAAMRFAAKDAVPRITLDDGSSEQWEPRQDLLSSRTDDKHFVLEVEADGRGRIRFGDGTHGARPSPGVTFTARYRVGNGRTGDVGAEALAHVVSGEDGIESVTNPLAAVGGVELETVDEVRQYAPVAFRPQTVPGQPSRPDGRTLRRAVTPADYAALAETFEGVQRAAATFRWTGSWRTVSVTVDLLGGAPVTPTVAESLRSKLEPFRLAGHDVEIEPPRLVSLEIAIAVRMKLGYFPSQVRQALLDVLSNRVLSGGSRGIFHPDNLTFGQTVYLSPLYAAAQAVDGVESLDVTTFQRRDRPGPEGLETGRLELGRLEIARLDNDPDFPERGTLTLTLEAGR